MGFELCVHTFLCRAYMHFHCVHALLLGVRPLVSYSTDYIIYTWNPSLPRTPLTLKFLYSFSDWYTTIPPPHRIKSYFDVTYVKVSNEIFYCIYDLSRFLGLHVHRSYQMRENSYWIGMPMSL